MKVIFINGLPATGKTTLARKLSRDLGIPFFIKDDFKEILYDEVGYENLEEKIQFEVSALKILYYILERHLEQGRSLILEANFYSKHSSPVIKKILEKYPCRVVQIQCLCDGEILYKRFLERALEGNRHIGHGELSNEVIKKWKKYYINGIWRKLEINGEYIELDTQDFSKINYEKLYDNIGVLNKK